MKKLAIALLCALTSTYALASSIEYKERALETTLNYIESLDGDCADAELKDVFYVGETVELDEETKRPYLLTQQYYVLTHIFSCTGNDTGFYDLISVKAESFDISPNTKKRFRFQVENEYSSLGKSAYLREQEYLALDDESYSDDEDTYVKKYRELFEELGNVAGKFVNNAKYNESTKILTFDTDKHDSDDANNFPSLKYQVAIDLKNQRLLKNQFIKKLSDKCFSSEVSDAWRKREC